MFSNLSSSKSGEGPCFVAYGIKMCLKCLTRMVVMLLYDQFILLWAKSIRRVLYHPEGKGSPAGVCTLKYSISIFG